MRVKTLLRARPSKAVLSSPGTLKNAPYELTAAGLGDVLAHFVCWRFARKKRTARTLFGRPPSGPLIRPLGRVKAGPGRKSLR